MPNRILLTQAIFLFSLAVAQAQPFVIKGQHSLLKESHVLFVHYDTYLLESRTDTIRVDATGHFRFSWDLKDRNPRGYLKVDAKNTMTLFGSPGEELDIVFNDADSSASFVGPSARIHQYLYREDDVWNRIYTKELQQIPDFKSRGFVYSDRYFQFTDRVTTQRIDSLRSFFNGAKTLQEETFVRNEERLLIGWDLYYKSNPPGIDLRKFAFAREIFPSEGPYFAFTDSVSFDRRELYEVMGFQEFATMFFMQCALKKLVEAGQDGSDLKFVKEAFRCIDLLAKDPFCNTVLKVTFLSKQLDLTSLSHVDPLVYEAFFRQLPESHATNPLIAFIEKKLSSLILAREPVNIARVDTISFTDLQGRRVALSDFKGKALYINVWASWCRPCLEKMPDWNKLARAQADNSDIAFITISLDTKTKSWKSALEKHNISGIHFIDVREFDGAFAKALQIDGIPRMVLVDREGKVIDAYARDPKIVDLSILK